MLSFLPYVQGDPNLEVRARMVDAGIAIIDKQGKDNVGLLLPIFENYLDKKVCCLFLGSQLIQVFFKVMVECSAKCKNL